MALVSVICGAKDWAQVVVISEGLEIWLSQYVDMAAGVPCEQTFVNIFNAIDPKALNKALMDMGEHLRQPNCKVQEGEALGEGPPEQAERDIISYDGQTLRGTRDGDNKAIHLMHAWSTGHGVCLGQLKVDDKSNEITAMPALMDMMELKGAIITADALNTQRAIAAKAIEKGADYVLPVKGNQEGLQEEVELTFSGLDEDLAQKELHWKRACQSAEKAKDSAKLKALRATPPKQPSLSETEKGHGRVEVRTYTVTPAAGIPSQSKWRNIKSLVRVVRERTIGGKTTRENLYYISSLDPSDIALIAQAIRRHWGVENGLHWRLDVIFRQDHSRYRDRIGACNLAVIRKFALAALMNETSLKKGMATKQAAASVNPAYRQKVLESCFKNVF